MQKLGLVGLRFKAGVELLLAARREGELLQKTWPGTGRARGVQCS